MRKRVYQRNGHWFLDYTDHTGQRIRKMAPEAGSRKQALGLVADELHDAKMIRKGYTSALDNSAAVEGILDAFLLHKLATRRYDTVTFYGCALGNILGRFKTADGATWPPRQEKPVEVVRSMVRTFQPGALAVARVDEITPGAVEVYIEARRSEATIRTLNAAVVGLKTMLSWAAKAGRIKSNPIASMSWVGKPAKSARALDVAEVEALLEASPEPYRTYWLALVTTGMRRGEFTKLRWPEVDFRTDTIRVLAGTSKGKRQRDVPIAPDLRERLLAMRATAADPEGFVFVNEAGKPWRNNLGKRLDQCVEAAFVGKVVHRDGVWVAVYREDGREVEEPLPGIRGWKAAKAALWERRGHNADGISLHTLRHTFATALLLNGVNAKVVSDLLGHASIQITLDIYQHTFPRSKSEAIAKLPFGGGENARKGHPQGTGEKVDSQVRMAQ